MAKRRIIAGTVPRSNQLISSIFVLGRLRGTFLNVGGDVINIEDSTVTVMVRDLDRAQTFYVETLGFRVLYRAGPHFCMLEQAGLKLGLHPKQEGADDTGASPTGMSVGFRVADIHAAVAALSAVGVAFPQGVVDDDGAILRASFNDPDGTPLYLVQMLEGA